ncbi:MAG: hypothetical protein IJ586_00055 [Alloprevotella sp.]|nr:hypothetical protein [Alloprevotella sp.]
MNELEKLIVAQALFKVVRDQVETKNPDNLRGAVDRQYAEVYNALKESGAAPKSFAIELAGQNVGSYSITVTKPKPSETIAKLVIDDKASLSEWDGGGLFAEYCKEYMEDYARWYFDKTGEVPEGCSFVEVVVPEVVGGEISRTTLNVDEKKVLEVVGAGLPEAAMMLLEDGNGIS